MSDKPLSIKEQKFVRAITQGANQSEAVRLAGYNPSTPQSAASMANTIMKRERVQHALALAIEEEFPEIAKTGGRILHEILVSPASAPMEKIKALEVLMKIFGWQAPTKSAHLNVNVQDTFKLPEE